MNETKVEVLDSKVSEGNIIVNIGNSQQTQLTSFFSLREMVYSKQDQLSGIQERAVEFQSSVETMQAQGAEFQNNVEAVQQEMIDFTEDNEEYVEYFLAQFENSRIQGQDNMAFYHNIASPVAIRNNTLFNIGSLIPFYLILVMSVFALVNANYVVNLKIKDQEKNIFKQQSLFSSLNKYLIILSSISLVSSLIISFLGLQALQLSIFYMFLWFSLILIISLSLSFLFFSLLYRLKSSLGILVICGLFVIYFISNNAIGLSANLPILRGLSALNPLNIFENNLMMLLSGDGLNLLLFIVVLLVINGISVALLYLPQLRLLKNEKI
jgi:hypothetical protein